MQRVVNHRMYTLILQSRSAKESYDEFYPLLASTVSSGDIKVCDWIEDGTTLETSVPELMSLVEHKKQWRAVVVQLDLEDQGTEYQTVDGNPFHFIQYRDKPYQNVISNGQIAYSNIPLVRLTQMLGGIPAPAPRFEMDDGSGDEKSNTDGEETKAPEEEGLFAVYHQSGEKETNAIRKKVELWNEAHLSQFSPPSEILLVRVRRSFAGVHDYELVNEWGAFKESDSSTFWLQNGYANGCRFLVFNVDAHGELRRRSDMFRLWLCVQMLAENTLSSSVLQANRLYRMNVEVDEQKLSANIQKTTNQLNYAQVEISHHLREIKTSAEPQKPAEIDIHQKITVDLEQIEATPFIIDEDSFSLTPENQAADRDVWSHYTDHTHRKWSAALRTMSRKLDKAARTLRISSVVDEDQVFPLTEYQEEDLRDQLDEYYTLILEEQENLPANEFDLKDALAQQEKEVQKAIDRRLRQKSAARVRIWSALLIIASMSCGFVMGGSRFYLAAAVAAAILLALLAVWIILEIRFRKFIRVLKKYEGIYRKALEDMHRSDTLFSSFFSKIASRIRGENYLSILKRERERQIDRIEIIERQIKKVEWFQETLQHWCEALQLTIDMNNRDAINMMVENRHRLQEEDLYQLETCRPRPVEVGQTGTYVNSSYAFINRLIIEREEVFDHE